MRTKPHRCGFALLLAVTTNCAEQREQRLATAPAPVLVVGTNCAELPLATAPAPAACDVTKPNGVVAGSEQVDANSYGNHELSLGPFGLWPDGTVIFKPGGAGFVTRECGLGMKFGWQRGIRGRLTIEGHRLDGSAPPLRSAVAQGYSEIGFQPTYLVFSTPGCWEVTGHVGEATLTFVTRVVKVGDGPTWRYDPW